MHHGHNSPRSIPLRVEAFESRSAPALIWTGYEGLDPLLNEPAMIQGEPSLATALAQASPLAPGADEGSSVQLLRTVTNASSSTPTSESLNGPALSTRGENEIDGYTGEAPYSYGSPPGGAHGFGQAPVIINFKATEESNLWTFSGTVVDNAPGGLTVHLGGTPASLQNQIAITDAAGNFTLDLQLQTNGSDTGTATAVTTDTDGLTSNVAECYVSP